MSTSTSVWPSRDAYQTAVLNPERNLREPRLHGTAVAKLKMGMLELPHPRSGNFGAVYKFTAPGRAYALKVFDKAQPDRQQRYMLIDRHLATQASSPHLVSLQYDPQGIRVGSGWYPTLLMDWVEGLTLDSYMEQTLKIGAFPNGRLCRAFADLMQVLAQRQIAHGDLQHGNILILGDGSLKLVDYDGMFVPTMQAAGLTATEIGLPAYQHPKRFRGYFDGRLDHFSALVILLTLGCATADLWKRYPPDENCLILRESDLVRPDQSPLLAELAGSTDRPIAKLAAILKRAAKGDLDRIPAFADLLTDTDIRSMLDPSWRPAQSQQQSREPVSATARPKSFKVDKKDVSPASDPSARVKTTGIDSSQNVKSNPTSTNAIATGASGSTTFTQKVEPPPPVIAPSSDATQKAPDSFLGELGELTRSMIGCALAIGVFLLLLGALAYAARLLGIIKTPHG